MSKGTLYVYSGASGVGKGTVMKILLEKDKNLRLSVSATTRQPREGEIDGVHYYFVSDKEFDKMIEEDGFFEHAEYCSHKYGTPKKPVFDMLDKGIDVILEIDIKGFLQVKEKYPECVTIFLMPPSMDELERRLKKRGTESNEVISQRLKQAEFELPYQKYFDYCVLNDDSDRAAEEILSIISNKK